MADETKMREALSKGEVLVRVRRKGIYQNLPFKLVRRRTACGLVPFLVLDRPLDLPEIVRVSEEYRLPVESPVGKVFPSGKKETDFAGL